MTRAGLALALLAIAPCAVSGQIRNVKPGEPAPKFSLKDQHGKVHTLQDYRGKPVVLCYLRQGQQLSTKALAALSKVQSRAAKDGVVFLALRREASPEPGPNFPVLRDDAESFYGSYGLFVLPVTIVLDKEHRLASVFSSYTPDLEQDLQGSIDTILGRPRRLPSSAEDSPTHDSKSTLQARLLSAESSPSTQ